MPPAASGSMPALNASTSAADTGVVSWAVAGWVNFWKSFTENSKPGGVRRTQPRLTLGRG